VSVYPSRLLAPQESGTTTLILGSSFTGKTYLLAEELELLKPYEYDLIILFTESVNVPQIQKFKERPDIIIKEGFNDAIPLFLKKLNSKLKNRYRFLLILDDIISEKSSRKSTLGKMLTTYRNSNISTCP
jgi:DNA replication protein DnaC